MNTSEAALDTGTRGPVVSRKPHIKIRPPSRWTPINVREMWHFRDLFTTFAMRDVKLRYRQTVLGAAWVVLQPLAGAGIFSIVFGRVAGLSGDGVPYFLFSYISLLAWNVFASTVTKSSISTVSCAGLISKIYFPRLILPISVIFSTLIDFGVGLAMGVVLMATSHVHPGAAIVLLPVWFVLILMLALGVGLISSALNVSYRDIGYIVPVAVQFLLFASPVAYSVSSIPESLHLFYALNPISGLVEAFRWSMLNTSPPTWSWVIYSAVFSVALFIAGAYAFKSLERKFADVI